MNTKLNLFLGSIALTLACNAFSSESWVAGRYHVEGSSDNNASVAQTGRSASTSSSVMSSNNSSSHFEVGQTNVAGRYEQNRMSSPSGSYQMMAPSYAEMRTQRPDAADVSNKPANANDRK